MGRFVFQTKLDTRLGTSLAHTLKKCLCSRGRQLVLLILTEKNVLTAQHLLHNLAIRVIRAHTEGKAER